MWEEYALPGLLITFILGVILGINIGMLCIPRFFEPTYGNLSQQFMKDTMPLRYPSGFTAKQLQQQDFVQRPMNRPPIGHNANRRTGGFTY